LNPEGLEGIRIVELPRLILVAFVDRKSADRVRQRGLPNRRSIGAKGLPVMHQTTNTRCALDQWYVVHCKPIKESYAAAMLQDWLGLYVYLPEVRRRFRGQIRQAPLFPRYLFVRANLQAIGVSSINATPGVLRLVTFGELPQPVPASVIETLRQRVDDFNARGGLAEHHFRTGAAVRLKDGPLRGLDAVFVGSVKPSERVRVLINFLGQLREAEVDVDTLEEVASDRAPKRERRTRGGGRRIKNP
jgi:transcriptional antiterminator RfaH